MSVRMALRGIRRTRSTSFTEKKCMASSTPIFQRREDLHASETGSLPQVVLHGEIEGAPLPIPASCGIQQGLAHRPDKLRVLGDPLLEVGLLVAQVIAEVDASERENILAVAVHRHPCVAPAHAMCG